MTEIDFAFVDYPLFVKRTIGKPKPKLAAGNAVIVLRDQLSFWDEKTGIIRIPLPRVLRWEITSAFLHKDVPHDADDLYAFIKGRYWPQIETTLYQKWLAEHGHKDYAETFGLIRYGQLLAYNEAHPIS
jgi:hypothetical protein